MTIINELPNGTHVSHLSGGPDGSHCVRITLPDGRMATGTAPTYLEARGIATHVLLGDGPARWIGFPDEPNYGSDEDDPVLEATIAEQAARIAHLESLILSVSTITNTRYLPTRFIAEANEILEARTHKQGS